MRLHEFSKSIGTATAAWLLTKCTQQQGRLKQLVVAACLVLLASHPAAALESVSLQLKWKHQFQFAGHYAALEQGFYRDAGLDVTIREGGPDIDVAEAVSERADAVGLDPQDAAGNRQVVMRLGLAAALGCAGFDDCRHRICSPSSFTHGQVLACARPADRRWWHSGRDARSPHRDLATK